MKHKTDCNVRMLGDISDAVLKIALTNYHGGIMAANVFEQLRLALNEIEAVCLKSSAKKTKKKKAKLK